MLVNAIKYLNDQNKSAMSHKKSSKTKIIKNFLHRLLVRHLNIIFIVNEW